MEIYKPQLNGAKVFKPGVYDISNEEYHASAGISRSALCEVKKSPMHYWLKYLSPIKEPFRTTEEMIFGEAVHTLIMEPHLFGEKFIIGKYVDGRTKEGKKYKEELALLADGKNILYEDEYQKLLTVTEAAKRHPLVPKLIKNGKIEQSIYWVDSETELLCKARPDIWTPNKLVDIKTTADATFIPFGMSVRKYNYHIQAAMQIDAIKEATGESINYFIFIAIQTTKPHKPYIYTLGDLEIEHGRREYKKLLKILRGCFDKNRWDLDRETITEINLPAFSFNNQLIDNLMEIYTCQN